MLDEFIKKTVIPKGFILLISGVPGVGKTTISYTLLKHCSPFRIIKETDILRDSLRGYNAMLFEKYGPALKTLLYDLEIYDNMKLLSLSEAKQQCLLMKKSLEYTIARQQRKGIATIINGVHIVPETLVDLLNNPNIMFINLYVTSEENLYQRLLKRDPESYMLQHIPFIYKTNIDLFHSTKKLTSSYNKHIYNIDVTSMSIKDTSTEILKYIQNIF